MSSFCVVKYIVSAYTFHSRHHAIFTHQVAPSDFAQNMDLVTERSNPKPTGTTLSSLFGPVVAPCISQSLGAATAADQAAIEKAAKWYRGAAG